MRTDRVGKRYWWLISVIKERGYHVGAEVGCAKGRTTYRLLKYCSNLRLYAVDTWAIVPRKIGGSGQYKDWNFRLIKKIFDQAVQPYHHRLTILRGISWEMAKQVKDNSLDFVFVDADHEYESVKKDILAWTPKLKEGMMMSGHDYDHPGVRQAIDELIPNWNDTGIDHCWFCKKEDILI